LAPFVGFHDGRSDDGDEGDKQNRFDDHISILRTKTIEDGPATVVDKTWA
jgi:hypothetical protein